METNKLKKIINNNYIKYGLILIAGLFIGWLIFGASSNNQNESSEHVHEEGCGTNLDLCHAPSDKTKQTG